MPEPEPSTLDILFIGNKRLRGLYLVKKSKHERHITT